MRPDIWGQYFWVSIHYIALGYPVIPTYDEKAAYKAYFLSLHYVIPCKTCSDHYQTHLKIRPIMEADLESNETLFKWTVDIHNMVNADLGKSRLSYKDALDMYVNTLPNNNNQVRESLKGTSSFMSNTSYRRWMIFSNLLIILLVVWMISRRSSRRLF